MKTERQIGICKAIERSGIYIVKEEADQVEKIVLIAFDQFYSADSGFFPGKQRGLRFWRLKSLSMKKRLCFITAESTAIRLLSLFFRMASSWLMSTGRCLWMVSISFLITACLCMRKRIPERKNESYLYHLLGEIS